MSSKTSFFNATIAKKGLRRTFPVWLTHLVIWIFALPILMSNLSRYLGDITEAGYYILSTVHIGGTLMAFFFSSVMTELLWGYLYSSKSIGFYHALPVKRSSIFATNLLVGLGALLIPAALCGGMALIVLQASGLGGAISYILNWFWIYTQMCVFFTGFSLLCAQITGHTAGGPVIYVILNFAAIALETTVRYVTSLFLYGIEMAGDPVTKALSPIFNIYYSCGVVREEVGKPYYYQGSGYLLALLIAGAVMAVLAFLLYKTRRSESAGEIISARPLRPVFKYCMTAGFAFIVGMIFYVMSYEVRGDNMPNIAWFTVCMITGGAVGYFASEMLLKKSFRVFKSSARGFIAAAIVIVLFGCSIGFDLFGIEARVPSLDEIEKINVGYSEASFTATVMPGDECAGSVLELHESLISNKQRDLELLNDRDGTYYDYDRLYYVFNRITIDYTLKNGSKLSRYYFVPTQKVENGVKQHFSDYSDKLRDIFADREIIKRAYPMLWEDAGSYRLSEAYIYEMTNYEQSYMLSSTAFPGLSEALKTDLLNGTLTTEDQYYFDYDEMEGVDCYQLEVSFWTESEDIPDQRRFVYHSFVVTPQASGTYGIISNPENYQAYEEGDTTDIETQIPA